MEIKERKIKGVYEVILKPLGDNRGFFMRTYDNEIFRSRGLDRLWMQENHSSSSTIGIIRGLHFQLPPYSETKMVRCISGAILDVFVDLREGSETFGHWDSVELSAENKKIIYIPRGFAHGFCTLSEHSEVVYKVDNFYNPESERGLLWNDPEININWPVSEVTLSDKDKANMTLSTFKKEFKSIKL